MKFLDGLKTKLGVLGAVASILIPAITQILGKGVEVGDALVNSTKNVIDSVSSLAAGASAILILLGLKHKQEKKAETNAQLGLGSWTDPKGGAR